MSDLISRNKAISVLEQLNGLSLNGKMDISNTIYLLENQPIAYDIDRVVKQLEDEAERWEDSGKEYNDKHEIAVARGLRNAIEVVKQGGVSDDVCEYEYNTAPSKDIYFLTSCGHRHNGMLDNSLPHCGFCGKKIKVVEQ